MLDGQRLTAKTNKIKRTKEIEENEPKADTAVERGPRLLPRCVVPGPVGGQFRFAFRPQMEAFIGGPLQNAVLQNRRERFAAAAAASSSREEDARSTILVEEAVPSFLLSRFGRDQERERENSGMCGGGDEGGGGGGGERHLINELMKCLFVANENCSVGRALVSCP